MKFELAWGLEPLFGLLNEINLKKGDLQNPIDKSPSRFLVIDFLGINVVSRCKPLFSF
jgi:hypothetical protein